MSKTICRICLRTDLNVHDINEDLVYFHDEITEYAIYENAALKYCTLCEHLLKKCYRFSQKCRKANKILKEVKLKKKGYPSNLHRMLQPSLECSIPDTLKQFNLINGNLIPLSVQLAVVKQENDTNDDDLDNNDCAVDTLQINFEEDDESPLIDHKRFAKLPNIVFEDEEPKENIFNNRVEILNLNSLDVKVKTEDSSNDEDVDEDLSATDVTTEINQNLSDTDLLKELNDDSLDIELLKALTKQGLHEDASDTEMIKELMTEIKTGTKRKLKVRKAPKIPPRKPLPNRDEIEKVFEVQLFATDQEAREELEMRKDSEYFLSAEHKCEICFSVFRHAKVLDYHMRWHDVSAGTHECDICHMRFKRRVAMKSHSNESHFGRFQCKKCPLVTYHRTAMLKHYEKHLGIIFDCKICGHTFKHPSTYNTHVRLRHRSEHVCVSCARTFVSEKGLIAHRRAIHNTKTLVDSDATMPCESCGIVFANEQVYTIHLKNTEKHKDLASQIIGCRLCGLRFEDMASLKAHRLSEHYKYKGVGKNTVARVTNLLADDDNFNCTICGMEGTSRFWMYKHVEAAHPETPYAADLKQRRQFMCENCGKCYTSLAFLRDHMNTHSGLKPYSCKQCPKRFGTRLTLKLHEEWHAPAKRECKQCGKKFVSASNLSSHMRTHIQDRRYKCSLCNKGFYHGGTLREHIRGVHNNVRRVRKPVKREADSES